MKKIEEFFQKLQNSNKRLLQDISLDDLLDEIKERGFQVQLNR